MPDRCNLLATLSNAALAGPETTAALQAANVPLSAEQVQAIDAASNDTLAQYLGRWH